MAEIQKIKYFDEVLRTLVTVAAILVSVNVSMLRDLIGWDIASVHVLSLVITLLIWSFHTLIPKSVLMRTVTSFLLCHVIASSFVTFMTFKRPTSMEFLSVTAVAFLVACGSAIYLTRNK